MQVRREVRRGLVGVVPVDKHGVVVEPHGTQRLTRSSQEPVVILPYGARGLDLHGGCGAAVAPPLLLSVVRTQVQGRIRRLDCLSPKHRHMLLGASSGHGP